MGTEVLRPQDCFVQRLRVTPAVFPRQKSCSGNPTPSNSNPRSCRRQYVRPEPKKRVQHQSEPSGLRKPVATESNPARNLVIGQVTILKRGESLDLKRKDQEILKRTGSGGSGGLVVCGTERLGPDPEMVPKQIRMTDLKTLIPSPGSVRSDVYAGSAFSLSPSPRALPLPRFSRRKEGPAAVDDSATKDLRRLLRLD